MVWIDVLDFDVVFVLVMFVCGIDVLQIVVDGVFIGVVCNVVVEVICFGGVLGINLSVFVVSVVVIVILFIFVVVVGSGEVFCLFEDIVCLIFYEFMFVVVGVYGGLNVKFQLSFKFWIFQLENLVLVVLLDNVYFGYMQFLLWDVGKELVLFCDMNYWFSVFYYWFDMGIYGGVFMWLLFVGGIEYELNGCDGDVLCVINIVFVCLMFYFGDLNDYYWKFELKLYVYFMCIGNIDIVYYWGFGDFCVFYGVFNGWELVVMLCKGICKVYGSVDV